MNILSRTRTLSVKRAAVVGILNLTPDSFYDGGAYKDTEAVLRQAERYLVDGADILELGAESTNQHSIDLSTEEELLRLLPVLSAIRKQFSGAWISVDTYKSEVARIAVENGADLINDVTAGRGDSSMFACIAAAGVPYVMMYSKDATARTTVAPVQYQDVVQTVHAFLQSRKESALQTGVHESAIIVDPGLGHFISSEPHYSYTILDQLSKFSDLGPILVSPSRKSFLSGPKNDPPSKRLPATLKATQVACKNGASFIRTHDVRETVECISSLRTNRRSS